MPPIDNIFAVLVAGFFLSATPGPSMLYVLSHSVGQNRTAGYASAFGLALGGMALAIATALGLAQLFEQVPNIVVALRYVGSVYLVWLGLEMIWRARAASRAKLEVTTLASKPISAIVWQGVIVELLNPKTVLFFALFLPPFVEAAQNSTTNDVRNQLLILGALVPLTAIPSDILVAYMGGSLTNRLNQQQKLREGMAWAGGSILILIAANLHLGFI
ncbi:LysE family translocator [uncultured Sulfitobacter sp.]|uniref:LysE family translocator n=1 Tax=uncultured Sulfitobacter sp. TaxID=191468 RepID=UPI00262F0128|nr:LysE family translocator [uncultured Sulfitobacter sp.]